MLGLVITIRGRSREEGGEEKVTKERRQPDARREEGGVNVKNEGTRGGIARRTSWNTQEARPAPKALRHRPEELERVGRLGGVTANNVGAVLARRRRHGRDGGVLLRHEFICLWVGLEEKG